MTIQWEKGSFRIATQDGRAVVEGLVSDEFGIRDAGRRRPIWTVTHLASGMLITPGAAGFSQREMAIAFAERIAALAGWNCSDRNAPDSKLGIEVVAIWNELIALDLAETVADHYTASVRETQIKPKPSRKKAWPDRSSRHGKHL